MIAVVREQKSFLISLFFIALFIRACVFFGYLSRDNRYWQVDSNTYNLVAVGISEGKGFCLPDGKPNFYRLPGYPLFVSLYYKIFGVNTKNVLWLQVILAAFIPVLIFLLSLSLFPQNLILAKIASVYTAFHIGFVLYAGFFMTETLFIFLFLLFAILFFRSFSLCNSRSCPSIHSTRFARSGQVPSDLSNGLYPEHLSRGQDERQNDTMRKDGARTEEAAGRLEVQERHYPASLSFLPDPIETSQDFVWFQEYMGEAPDTREELREYVREYLIETPEQKNMQRLLLAGFFLGLASLVRPVGQYVIIVSCIVLLFSSGRLNDRLARCYAIFLGWIVPVSFWLVRNYLLLGAIFFHTLPGGHFLYLSAARVAMYVKDCSYQEARDILQQEVNTRITEKEERVGHVLNEIERCHEHEKLAIHYFLQRPFLTIRFWLTDIMRASLSLYSAELLYLESGRKNIDYFKKERTIGSMFSRYLFPETSSWWLKFLIIIEIIFNLFILLGFFAGFIVMLSTHANTDVWCKVLPFMLLFIVISLAGGYARMRLPIEPFLIILSLSFWIRYYLKRKSV